MTDQSEHLITANQKKVFVYLKDESAKGICKKMCVTGISQNLDMSPCAVRRSISALEKYQLIKLLNKIKIGKGYSMDFQIIDDQAIADDQIYNKSMETHPELMYWTPKGVTKKLIEEWCDVFDIDDPAVILLSLKYCRFDMVENKLEEGVDGKDPVKSPLNWFYKIIEKTGGRYPRPSNYQSHAELNLEMLKQRKIEKDQLTAKTMEMTKELQVSRCTLINAEHKLAFEEMLADPNCDMYKKCYVKLPDVAKQRSRTKSLIFTMEMRKAYAEINDLEGFDDIEVNDVKIQDSYLEKLRKNDADTSRN